jgi:hypothetical protein
MNEHCLNTLQKLKGVFTKSRIVDLKIGSYDSCSWPNPKKYGEIKTTKHNKRTDRYPWLNKKNRADKKDDHHDAGDNLADWQHHILDECHDIPEFLIEISSIPSQKEPIGSSSIGLKESSAKPVAETVGISDSDDLAGDTAQARKNQHQDRKTTGQHEQMITVHWREQMQQPVSKRGSAHTIRLRCKCKEREDRRDSNELEQAIEKDKSQDTKKPQAAVREGKPVASTQ